jgi:hypothetical protein
LPVKSLAVEIHGLCPGIAVIATLGAHQANEKYNFIG